MIRRVTTLTVACVLGLTTFSGGAHAGDDDEPRGLGRLFRFGNRGQAARDAEARQRAKEDAADREQSLRNSEVADPSRLLRANPRGAGATPGSSSLAPYSSLNPAGRRMAEAATNPGAAVIPNDVGAPAAAAGPRLVPQPRNSRPVTEAPPLLTRVQLGRSDDGRTFGMFLQIYSDGTVVDTEGVHKVGRDVLAPLVEALRAADAGRIQGHCGSPPVDYIEQVMVIVYDNARGRLQANSFSYSGNTQGCNPAIRTLQSAIDAVQAKITPTAPAPAPATSEVAPPATPVDPMSVPRDADAAPAPPALTTPGLPNPSPPVLLTPIDEE